MGSAITVKRPPCNACRLSAEVLPYLRVCRNPTALLLIRRVMCNQAGWVAPPLETSEPARTFPLEKARECNDVGQML
ncbi:hypothetical protein ABBQ32_006866 [Trebouxia sp. C0010 RCD-2024]